MPAKKSAAKKPARIPFKMMMTDMNIHFVEYERREWEGYTLIEGFPGMGLVGTISAKFLVEHLDFKQIGYIYSDSFMPIIRIHEGLPVHPSRIYVNDKHKLVVLISEQIIPRPFIPQIAHKVVEWIEQNKIKKVISLAGLQTGQKEDMTVYGIAANKESKKYFKGLDIKIIDEGITTGITAVMLLHLKDTKVHAFSILGNVTFGADYKAAAELIKRLNKLLDLKMDVKPLYEKAKKTEEEIVSQMKKVQEAQATQEKIEKDTSPSYYA
jgi:uncharacterized protein